MPNYANNYENDEEFFARFIQNAVEWIIVTQNVLIECENDPNQNSGEFVDQLFRNLHTLKGSAPSFGYSKMQELAHGLESLIQGVQANHLQFNGSIVAVLIRGLQSLLEICQRVKAGHTEVGDEAQFGQLLIDIEQSSDPRAKEKNQLKEFYNQACAFIEAIAAQDRAEILRSKSYINLERSAECLKICITDPRLLVRNFYNDFDNFIKFSPREVLDIPEYVSLLLTLDEVVVSTRTLLATEPQNNSQINGEYYYEGRIVSKEIHALHEILTLPINEIKTRTIKRLRSVLEVLSEVMDNTALDVINLMYDKIVDLLAHKSAFTSVFQSQLLDCSNDLMAFVDSKSPSLASDKPKLDIVKIYRKDLQNFQQAVDSVIEAENSSQQLGRAIDKPESYKQFERVRQRQSVANKLLFDSLTKTLRIPIDGIMKRIPGIVRAVIDDLKQQGIEKQVHIEITGRDVIVDESIYNLLNNVVIHLVRNAVDHGLEPVNKRIGNGKSREGTLSIVVSQSHQNIHLDISDDGRGVSLDKVKDKAMATRIISAHDAQHMCDDAVLELLYCKGLSTTEFVTSTSGRGIGLDVVKNEVTNAHGQISVKSKLNKGTSFSIQLPASGELYIPCQAIMIGGQYYAVTKYNIRDCFLINSGHLIDGQDKIKWQDKELPIVLLHNTLEIKGKKKDILSSIAIVIENKVGRAVFIADELCHDLTVISHKLNHDNDNYFIKGTLQVESIHYKIINVTPILYSMSIFNY